MQDYSYLRRSKSDFGLPSWGVIYSTISRMNIHGLSRFQTVMLGWRSKQGIALLLQNATDQRALSKRSAAHDFFGHNVDLAPSTALQKANGSSENHRADACPEDRTLAHGTGFSGAIQGQLRPIEAGPGHGQLVDGVDFPMPDRIFQRTVPAFRHDLPGVLVHDHRSERHLEDLLAQLDGSPHVVVVLE